MSDQPTAVSDIPDETHMCKWRSQLLFSSPIRHQMEQKNRITEPNAVCNCCFKPSFGAVSFKAMNYQNNVCRTARRLLWIRGTKCFPNFSKTSVYSGGLISQNRMSVFTQHSWEPWKIMGNAMQIATLCYQHREYTGCRKRLSDLRKYIILM